MNRTGKIRLVMAILILLSILIYGPLPHFRDLWITSAMMTGGHQYYAKWLFTDKQIQASLDRNRVIDYGRSTPLEFRNQHLNRISVSKVSGLGFTGWVMIIDDPSRVSLATARFKNGKGETVPVIAERYHAAAAINAGGFIPDGQIASGQPLGLLISQGRVLAKATPFFSVVGFDIKDRLIIGKYGRNEIPNLHLRDAVSFSPLLIINGHPTRVIGNGGWGIAPRTAIGQDINGRIIFIVIDGRQAHSIGANIKDVQTLLLKYGAVNAANLDGGTSSTLYYSGRVINKPCGARGERIVPNAFIVR